MVYDSIGEKTVVIVFGVVGPPEFDGRVKRTVRRDQILHAVRHTLVDVERLLEFHMRRDRITVVLREHQGRRREQSRGENQTEDSYKSGTRFRLSVRFPPHNIGVSRLPNVLFDEEPAVRRSHCSVVPSSHSTVIWIASGVDS